MMQAASRARRRGYTLAELLVVVVMVGVLATLAVIGVRKYIYASKTSEAINMIGSIKAAEESYKDETFSYLDVSQGNLDSLYPMQTPGKVKHHWTPKSHDDLDRWRALGVSTNQPVQFGYAVIAGAQKDSPPQPGTVETFDWPTPSGPWYIVKAVADQDENGVKSVYVSSSFTTEIYGENEGE